MQRPLKLSRGHKLHQLINRKLPLSIPLHHPRHILRWVSPALDRADPRFSRHHVGKAIEIREIVIERRGADLDVFSVVARKGLAGVHENGGTRGVDGDGGADAVGDLGDDVAEGFAFVEAGAVDDVGCAELLGEFEAGGDFVDADDHSAALDSGSHDGGDWKGRREVSVCLGQGGLERVRDAVGLCLS